MRKFLTVSVLVLLTLGVTTMKSSATTTTYVTYKDSEPDLILVRPDAPDGAREAADLKSVTFKTNNDRKRLVVTFHLKHIDTDFGSQFILNVKHGDQIKTITSGPTGWIVSDGRACNHGAARFNLDRNTVQQSIPFGCLPWRQEVSFNAAHFLQKRGNMGMTYASDSLPTYTDAMSFGTVEHTR